MEEEQRRSQFVMDSDLRRLREELASVRISSARELASANEYARNILLELNETREQLQALANRENELVSAINRMREEGDKTSLLSLAERKSSELSLRATKAEAKCEALAKKVQQLEQMLKDEKTEYSMKLKEISERLSEEGSKQRTSMSGKLEIEHKLVGLEREVSSFREKNLVLEEQLDQARQDVKRLKDEQQSFIETNRKYESMLSEKEREKRAMQLDLETRLRVANATVSSLEGKHRNSDVAIKTLKTTLEDEISRLQEKLGQAQKEKTEFISQKNKRESELESEKMSLLRRVSEMEVSQAVRIKGEGELGKRIVSLQEELLVERTEKINAEKLLASEKAESSVEISMLRKKMECQQQKNEELQIKLNQIYEEAEQRLSRAALELSEARNEASEARRRADEEALRVERMLCFETGDLRSENERLERNNEDLRTKLEALFAETKVLRSRLEEQHGDKDE